MQDGLPLLGEVHSRERVNHETIKYESRTDLVACITDENIVQAYRLGGENAIRVEADSLSGLPTALCWARGGEVLFIGTDTGEIDTLQTSTGQVSLGPKARLTGEDRTAIVAIWNNGDYPGISKGSTPKALETGSIPNASEDEVDTWFERLNLDAQLQHEADQGKDFLEPLIHSLANINPILLFPRLSPIPPPSRAGPGMPAPVIRQNVKDLHILLNRDATPIKPDPVVTFVNSESGKLAVTIGELCAVTLKDEKGATEPSFVLHSTVDILDNHMMLEIRTSPGAGAEGQQKLTLTLIQNPFGATAAAAPHIKTMLSSASRLNHLQSYICQSIETLVLDWNTLTSLPTRFVSNINETLEEQLEGPLHQQLYQLLLTGFCSQTVMEWLKDDLAERGHKRWDHALTTFYHAATHLLEVNILPALEQCALSASTLRGFATYFEGSKNFDVPTSYFTSVIDATGCIQLLAHELLLILGHEERQFRAFSTWLRNCVDTAAAEPGSTAAAELAEKEAMSTDVPKILNYLDSAFVKSQLSPALGRGLQAAESRPKASSSKINMDKVAEVIKRARIDSKETSDLFSLQVLLANLSIQIERCGDQMVRWQNTSWGPPQAIPVVMDAILEKTDFQVMSIKGRQLSIKAMITGRKADDPAKVILQTTELTKHPKRPTWETSSQRSTTLTMAAIETVVDIKLSPDDQLIYALVRRPGQHAILRVSISDLTAARTELTTTIALDEEQVEQGILHIFLVDEDFTPEHIYLSDKAAADRRNILVLDADATRWRVFRLPA